MAKDRPADEEKQGAFSSPPCYMHELDPTYLGLATDEAQAADVARWRKAERNRLIEDRMALPISEREQTSGLIAKHLNDLIPTSDGTIVSVYWPFRGEPDLRSWMKDEVANGLRIALPVVVGKGQPLVFREWQPGCRMERGVWNIPIPADVREVVPDIVIAPLVGFDQAGFRLGYGGGFFDRTLAQALKEQTVIGVGYDRSAITTIYPQWHDIPMNWIVTGQAPPRAISRTPSDRLRD